MTDYHIGVAKETHILLVWNAVLNFMPILGAFLSDSYLDRFLTIGFASLLQSSGTSFQIHFYTSSLFERSY